MDNDRDLRSRAASDLTQEVKQRVRECPLPAFPVTLPEAVPGGSGVQMPWLPCGARCPMAPGRGVARLQNAEGGPLSWGEVGTHQTG